MMAACPSAGTDLLQGFAPLAAPGARVLVLGSMPGAASLRRQQYYAHSRNAFWPIAAALFGFDAQDGYEVRVDALMQAGVALWDVLQSCTRRGSLDAAIDPRSMQPNDFAAFYAAYPGIERVCFNGAKAAAVYRRQVLPGLPAQHARRYFDLPSTSPAHAALPQEEKLRRWRAALLDETGSALTA